MRHARSEVERDCHTGTAESLGVSEILVTEDVELTSSEMSGGRQSTRVQQACQPTKLQPEAAVGVAAL